MTRYVDAGHHGDRELVDRRRSSEDRRQGFDRREPGPGRGRAGRHTEMSTKVDTTHRVSQSSIDG